MLRETGLGIHQHFASRAWEISTFTHSDSREVGARKVTRLQVNATTSLERPIIPFNTFTSYIFSTVQPNIGQKKTVLLRVIQAIPRPMRVNQLFLNQQMMMDILTLHLGSNC